MEQGLIESLLNEEESSSLDFKRDQYPFDSATDDDKSELLKDVLAFANAWRRTDAYILIGVKEERGTRSTPVGVGTHLDDSKLQQFVNSKTNRPIEFSYRVETVNTLETVSTVEIGIIHIPLQERPIYLLKNFGKLAKDTVYIRQGSSTAIASPDEISKMRLPLEAPKRKPKLSLVAQVVSSDSRHVLVSIKNEVDAAPARAPRLLFKRLTSAFQVSQWGADGNGNYGLPMMPRSMGSPEVVFAGATSTVIHPGTKHAVTLIDYVGAPERRPNHLGIEYELTAEEVQPSTDTLEIAL